jgi:Zn-finger nucleic acid-binding protein
MDCVNCGAPLPAKSNVCRFCETLNDTDLRALDSQRSKRRTSERPCPRCKVPLESMNLKLESPVEIDRCAKCYGIFFDPGELEEVLDTSVKRVYDVDLERLDTLVREETSDRDYKEVKYVPCPDCGEFMHRKSYGAKAGVVVDRCRLHGLWLDGGELNRLLKWAKAGGIKHDLRETERRAENEARAKKTREIFRHSRMDLEGSSGSGYSEFGSGNAVDTFDLVRLLGAIARWVG